MQLLAYVAGVGRGRKEERRAREGREDRASPSGAHFDFPSFLRPATQAMQLQYTSYLAWSAWTTRKNVATIGYLNKSSWQVDYLISGCSNPTNLLRHFRCFC